MFLALLERAIATGEYKYVFMRTITAQEMSCQAAEPVLVYQPQEMYGGLVLSLSGNNSWSSTRVY